METVIGTFMTFAGLSATSMDYDPMYPVLRVLLKDVNEESAITFLMYYVAYYDVLSGLEAWTRWLDTGKRDLPELPCSTYRRGLRDSKTKQMHGRSLWSYHDRFGTWKAFLQHGWRNDPFLDWNVVRFNYGSCYQNGRWSEYKLVELLQKVLGWNVQPANAGLEGQINLDKHGPQRGVVKIYGPPKTNPGGEWLNARAWELQRAMESLGWNGLDQAIVETFLCDFDALVEGKYYLGMAMDEYLEALLRRPGIWADRLFAAREEALPHAYLGELHDWRGVQEERTAYYKTHKVILFRE